MVYIIKLVDIDWSLFSSPSYTYIHCFLFIGAKISKINVYKIYGSTIRFRDTGEFF